MINNNEIQIFNFEINQVRTLNIDGQPYFVGKDVADVLGYSNTRDALNRHVEFEDKKDGVVIHDSIGRQQTPTFINESGLYSLILSSKMPNAKKFKRWVTSEVLPAIVHKGVYMTDKKAYDITHDRSGATLADLLQQAADQLKQKDIQIAEMKPKALFADAVANAENTMLVRDVAHFLRQNGLDIGGTRFFVWLRLNGFLTKNNQPTQLSLERGYFKVKETVVHTNHGFQTKTTPKITGRGQTFFLKKMLKEQEEMKEMGL